VENRLKALEEDVRNLATAVAGLTARLERLEARETIGGAVHRSPGPAGTNQASTVLPEPTMPNLRGIPTLLGRTLLVLAGAFLLRALTDSEVLSRSIGVALGLVYAGIWMYSSDRAGARGAAVSSAIHGLTAAVIGFPLVWETTVRFQVWTPQVAAGILALLTAGGFAVAWRRDLRPLAWVSGVGGAVTSLALLMGTRVIEPFALVLIFIGLSTVWLSYIKKWFGVRWVTTALADLVVLQTAVLASYPGGPPEPYSSLNIPWAAGLGVVLFLGYAGSFTGRTLARRRIVTPFEVIQMTVALVVGLGGAIRIAQATQSGLASLGLLTLLLGGAAYGVAFTAIDRQLGRGRNFILYSTLAVTLLLAGSLVVSGGRLLPFLWAGLAVTTASLGGRYHRVTLRAHCAIYALAALAASGVLRNMREAFTSALDATWAPMTTSGVVVLVLTGICYAILAWTHEGDPTDWKGRIPMLVVGTLALSGLVTGAVLMARRLGVLASPATLAAARTVLLSGTSFATALLGKAPRLRELSWITYPVLILCGVKILGEDLRQGTPLTLFIGFAAYGLALLAAPRLQRRLNGAGAGSQDSN